MSRGLFRFLALVVLGAMAMALWQYLSPRAGAGALVLTVVEGTVELERPDAATVPANVGTELRAVDRIATGPDGRATLTLGQDTEINLRPRSTVDVVSIDEAGVSLELEGGALKARVRPESGAVRVGNRGREVLAVHGTFEVGVRRGVMLVRSLEGEASLTGVDQGTLAQGEQATVVDHHAEIGPIPEHVLLAVEWPDGQDRTRQESATVRGLTVPGAQVQVSGRFGEREARADASGRFRVEVPLEEGDNPVQIRASDVFGQSEDDAGQLPTRDTQAPAIRTQVFRRPEGEPP